MAPEADEPRDDSPLSEALLAPSTVRMFGRKFVGLNIGDLGANAASNSPLITRLREAKQRQAAAISEGREPDDADVFGLARVYGFSYLGNYYKLPDPPVMLVFGKGEKVPAGYVDVISMSQMGVEFKDSVFVNEIKVWAVDQLDISIRIDITIGWIKDILLSEEMSPDNNITGGQTVARSDLVGRAEVVGRAELVGRAEMITTPRKR